MESGTTSNAPLPERVQWDPALYDSKHSFVWKYGVELVELLSPQNGECILDLGCGTGHLSHQISLSGAKVTGLDCSQPMIEQARRAYPHLNFVLADAADFKFPEPFDAVFSNASLHWMKPAAQVAACIAGALRPGGRFVAEFGGKGNVNAIHTAIRKAMEAVGCPAGQDLELWYYPSIGEYAGLLEEHHFAVSYASLFDRLTPLEDGENGLRHWLEMFAGEFLKRLNFLQQQKFVKSVEGQLRSTLFRDGSWFADYKRIRIVATRE